MICRCGHPLEAHGDRAVYPPCEGELWPPQHSDHHPYGWLRTPRKSDVCECKGFEE